ncbi:hypothetical protein ACU6U9_18240 [Pseudomonas sp. HK3]
MFEKIKRIIEMVKNPPDKNWHIEKQGKPSKTHPLGGFWKRDLKNDHGLAIGKAPRGLYFISFCGPSGCFEKKELIVLIAQLLGTLIIGF